MMRTLFVAWALLAIAVQGRREESQSSGEGKQSQLDGTESAANAYPRKALVALLLALSRTQAFTLGPGGSRAVGQRTSSDITTLEAKVKGKGDEAAELPAEIQWKQLLPWKLSRRASLKNAVIAVAAQTLSNANVVLWPRLIPGAFSSPVSPSAVEGIMSLEEVQTLASPVSAFSPVSTAAVEGTMSKEEVLKIAGFLTPSQRKISLSAVTERPFTGKTTNGFSAHDNTEKGTYVGAISGAPVFSSSAKFDSENGWPSFYEAVPGGVIVRPDPRDLANPRQAKKMYDGIRSEIIDAKSGTHLGHLFNDGIEPTGKRYTVNAGAMTFVQDFADGSGNSVL